MGEEKEEKPGPGSTALTVAALQAVVGRLREGWDLHALRGAGAAASEPGAADAAVSGASASSWRGLVVQTHSLVPACLSLRDRLSARGASRAWCLASEHGPARAAWLAALSEASLLAVVAAAANEGGSLASCYARHRFLSGGAAAQIFKGTPKERGELKASGRLRTTPPLVPLGDGTAAALLDIAPVVLAPELVLTVYDMSTLTPIGGVPVSSIKHGKSIQRPVALYSLQPSQGLGTTAVQACVAAVERLVVVFSWELGGSGDGESGPLGLRNAKADEVRWGEGSKEALRSASFVGAGALAPVAVLLEGGRDGARIEIFGHGGAAGADVSTAYTLREVVPIAATKSSMAGVPGALYAGTVCLWAKVGERAIEFVRMKPPTVALADGTSAGLGGASGAAAAFARARQTAKTGRLKVGADGGAGLDMEATRWGYLVEEVEAEPGQPDVKAGDCILAIGGQVLYGLDDEVMNWRFGRNFADGVEVSILPAEHMKAVLAAEKGAGGAGAPAIAVSAAVQTAEQCKRQHFVFAARLEAWCIAATRDPPRLVVVTDNRLILADLFEDGAVTREGFSGVVRAPLKRPVERLAILDPASDVLLVATAGGVAVWRVPALLAAPFHAPAAAGAPPTAGQPELLATVAAPPRCSLVGVALGCSLSPAPSGWAAADLSGAGAGTDGGLDVWHFYSGRQRPLLQLPGARGRGAGRQPGLAGDAVSRAFAAVGAAFQKVAAAVQTAAPKADMSAAIGSWLSKAKSDDVEALYGAVDKAEPICAEAVRDLRRWLRAEGRGAGLARQDAAQALAAWVEECRRQVIWPLQVAFQAEASDSGSDDLPTHASAAANVRGTGAAAGTAPRGAQ